MIQFNLLPDVKLEYVKAERLKRTVISLCLLASAASLSLLIMLVLTVDLWQHKTIDDLSNDIKKAGNELKSTPDLDKILTVQGQLHVLGGLHDAKPTETRLFQYVAQLTPKEVTIKDLVIDHTATTISITGNAPSLDVVNVFADSLKFTSFTTASSTEGKPAFSGVVLSSFKRSPEGAEYTINATFDPAIFNIAESAKLKVPNIVTTRSVLEHPTELFRVPETEGGQGQ